MSNNHLLAYLRLLRIPNVFTAIADVMMGFLITHAGFEPLGPFALLVVTSCCLYLAGMVLNDVFDVEQDRKERPFRPIPSGRVGLRAAQKLGFGLLLAGLTLGMVVSIVTQSLRPCVVAAILALTVVLYDAAIKRTPLGPIAMGGCRLLNVLLGMSLAVDAAGALRPWMAAEWIVAAGIGVYIVGVTWFARTEARESSRHQLAAALAVLVSGMGLVASLPEWRDLGASAGRWYALWAVLVLVIGQPCIAAIREPTPHQVQLAVKRCLVSLILLDAAVCYGIRGPQWAAAILLLLVPQWLLGRYVYST
jgi:4-hydroxybenzoate polyprenyltransferase